MPDPALGQLAVERGRSLANLAGYLLMRVALLVVGAVVVWGIGRLIGVDVPVIVALLFSAAASMPLSWLLFKRWNTRIGADLARLDTRRRSERASLRAQLSGTEEASAEAERS